MRLFTLIALLLLKIPNGLCSQDDYQAYYLNCYKGDSLMFEKNYNDALHAYQTAFSKVSYVHYSDLKSAAECAIRVKDYKNAYSYIRQSVINSGEIGAFSVFKRVSSIQYKFSKYHRMMKDSLDDFVQMHEKRLNKEYCKILDSLHFVDQYVSRGTRHAKDNYNLNVDSVRNNKINTDSTNFLSLLACIEKWGWPSEKIIEDDDYLVIIHHTFRPLEHEKFHYLAIDAVKNGEYEPKWFAAWYSQYYSWFVEPGINPFVPSVSEVNSNNYERVNKWRKEFYLKPLTAYDISINKKGFVSMKELW